MNTVAAAIPVPVPVPVPPRPELSVVIPAYNEAARVAPSLVRLIAFLSGPGRPTFEVVVVDDGSQDGTHLVAARHDVRVLRLRGNRGKGAALRAGVAASLGRRVLFMDADLATPVEDLDALSAVLDRGAQVAVGSRAVASSDVVRPQSPLRVLLGRAGNLWIRALAVGGIHDTQCGFKLFDGDVARRLFALCEEERFGIDIEVLCLARRFRIPVEEVGVHWEHQAGSKVTWRDYLDVLVQVPRIAWSARRRAR